MEYRTPVRENGDCPGLPKKFRQILAKNYGGKSVRFRITELKPRASGKAHGYYREVVLMSVVWRLADLGNDVNPYSDKDVKRVHDDLKFLHLEYRQTFCDADGLVYERAPTLEEAPANVMAQYIEKVRTWAMESLDIFIPDADKDWKKKTGQLGFFSVLESEYPAVVRKYRDI